MKKTELRTCDKADLRYMRIFSLIVGLTFLVVVIGTASAEYEATKVWDSGSIIPDNVLSVNCADLDGDGKGEIITGGWGWYPEARIFECTLDNDYNLIWTESLGDFYNRRIPATRAIGDVDGDNKEELVIAGERKVYFDWPQPRHVYYKGFWIYKSNGDNQYEKIWESVNSEDWEGLNNPFTSAAIADIDNNDENEIILGDIGGNIYIVIKSDDQYLWFPAFSVAHFRGLTTADVVGDAMDEIVTYSHEYFVTEPRRPKIQVFTSAGGYSFSEVFEISGFGDRYDLPTVADADKDGKKEIIFTVKSGSEYRVNVFENDGFDSYTKVWESDTIVEGGEIAVDDTDNNGKEEIIVGGDKIYVFENIGDNLYTKVWDSGSTTGTIRGVTTGDADGDGKKEIIVGSLDNKAYVFEVEVPPSLAFTQHAPPSSNVAPGTPDVLVNTLDFTATENILVDKINITLYGIGSSDDLWDIKIYKETGGDGFDSTTDLFISDSETLDSCSGSGVCTVTLGTGGSPAPQTIATGDVTWYIVFDIASTATIDNTIGGKIASGADISAKVDGEAIVVQKVGGDPSEVRTIVNLHILPVPYFNQRYTNWCMYNSLAMVLQYYDVEVHSWDIARHFSTPHDKSHDIRPNPATDNGIEDYITNIEGRNFKCFWICMAPPPYMVDSWFDNRIKDPISHGRPVIFGISFHVIVFVGYAIEDDTKYVYIHDPAGNKGIFNEPFNYENNGVFEKVPWETLKNYVNSHLAIGLIFNVCYNNEIFNEEPATPHPAIYLCDGDIFHTERGGKESGLYLDRGLKYNTTSLDLKPDFDIGPNERYLRWIDNDHLNYKIHASNPTSEPIDLSVEVELKGNNDVKETITIEDIDGQSDAYKEGFIVFTEKGSYQLFFIAKLNGDAVDKIGPIYINIVKSDQTASEITNTIYIDEQVAHTIPLDPTTEATFEISWQGSTLNLTLLTPEGVLIDPTTTDPNITHVTSATYEYYTIKNPAPGNWTMNITAVDVPPEGEKFTAVVYIKTNLTLSLETDKYRYDPGESISIHANLTNNSMPVTGASVQAEVQRPDGSENITLFDDGTHGDAQTNDGVYSNTYTDTSAGGTYKIKATARGTIDGCPFVRERQTSVLVQLAPDLIVADIIFSNNTPSSGNEIIINATIQNIGDVNASHSTVEFYDGDPYLNGTYIGSETITTNLTLGEAVNVATSWTAKSGSHNIFVHVPPLALEINESNNIANKTVYVTAIYNLSIIAAGTDKLICAPDENVTIYCIVENADHELFSPDIVYAEIKNHTFNLSEYSTGYYMEIFNQTSQAGTYNVTIYANKTGYENDTAELSFEVVSDNQAPIAKFTHSPEHPVVNQTVTFNATSSYDPDGNITNYEWAFGDGTNGTDELITHSYSSAGDYTVNLTVTDTNGATNITAKMITVTMFASPTITFYAPPSHVNDTVCNWRTFNVTVNQTVNVSWYLNDTLQHTNESTKEANYTLHAEVVGEHNVSAIASNENGTDMQTWVWNVTVAPEPVLEINKTGVPDPVSPGGALNYTILVNNTGDATATNITVTETYDGNVTFVAAVPAPSSGDDTWIFATLNVSETRWINISVSVNASVPNGTVLHNFVNLSCDEGVMDSDTENTTVFAAPVLNCTCGDICVNTTGWWRDGGAFNASNTPIQHAIDNATAGDTICVKDGT